MPSPDSDTPRRGRPPQLLRVACPTCGATINAYCRSRAGKVLTNGHTARRDAANLTSARHKPGPNSRPQATTIADLGAAIKRAVKVGKGIRLSRRECEMLVEVLP